MTEEATKVKRNFQGVWIPAEIWLNKDLSIMEKVMLVEINSLQDPKRGCFSSNSYLAEFFNLSPSRVSEIITSLAKKGCVKVSLIKDGKRVVERQIRMQMVFGKSNTKPTGKAGPKGTRKTEGGYSENSEKGIRFPEGGYSEKAQGNNTGFNNTDDSKTDAGASPKILSHEEQFNLTFLEYPKRAGNNPKDKAFTQWKLRVKEGFDPREIFKGVRAYKKYCDAENMTGTGFVMQGSRFFGKDKEFQTDWTTQNNNSDSPTEFYL